MVKRYLEEQGGAEGALVEQAKPKLIQEPIFHHLSPRDRPPAVQLMHHRALHALREKMFLAYYLAFVGSSIGWLDRTNVGVGRT